MILCLDSLQADEDIDPDVRTGVLEVKGFLGGSFDVVTRRDPIEHMPHPLASMNKCWRIMKDGGIFVIHAPDISSILARRLSRPRWFLLSHHLHYFTGRPITTMLAAAGSQVVDIRRHCQTLEFGHLMKMRALYGQPISSIMAGLVTELRVVNVRIPYYVSQMNAPAQKLDRRSRQ